jgi:outer membrane protein OmpA-like peptidoglycan-associated protein
MKYLQLLFVVVILINPKSSFSQEEILEKANKDFDQFAYIDSREIYLRVVEKGYQSQDIYQRLGDSYYFNADLNDAAYWYGTLIEVYETNVNSEYYFRYAQCLKSLGQYEKSDEIMERFYELKETDDRAKLFFKERNYLTLIELQSGRFVMSELTINSKFTEFAPNFYLGDLVFASNNDERGVARDIHKWNNEPFLDLYIVKKNENAEQKKFSEILNTIYHESTASFTKDGNVVYFTRNNFTNTEVKKNTKVRKFFNEMFTKKELKKSSNGTNLLKIYRSEKGENGWSEAVELPFNSDEYSVAHPALSEDEKTLYFASDMPGGEGLSDLYSVSIEEDGYGDPVSLGDVINTEGRETFPFVASNGDLYVSSDGHQGLGGLDIFVFDKNDDGTYGEGFNIGEPINSPSDDFTFVIDSNTGLGYFASNREGGMGGDDIYSFKQITPPIKRCFQNLTGIVRNIVNDEIIAGAKVELLDEENNIVKQDYSSENGYFDFGSIDCEAIYSIRAYKDDHEPSETTFTTTYELSGKLNKTVYLLPKVKVGLGVNLNDFLNPIYFDLNESFIREDAEIELQKIIEILKVFPKIKIDIRSHTDSRSNDSYNMQLSQRRSESTINYILEKGGISEDRITGRGYGETLLLNDCGNGSNCSEEDHQLNRRSEFIILEK